MQIAIVATALGWWFCGSKGIHGFVVDFVGTHEETVPSVRTLEAKGLKVHVKREPCLRLFVRCEEEGQKAEKLKRLWTLFPALKNVWCEIGRVGPRKDYW